MSEQSTPPSVDQQSIEYRFVPGRPNYRVGTDGSVWSNFRGVWKRMKPSGKRYLKVTLCPGRQFVNVQTLVLEAFVGPCPDGMQACHFPDRNTANNALSNLRYGTPVQNQADRLVHGTEVRGEKHYLTHLTEDDVREIRRRRASGETLVALGAAFGITNHAVFRIVKRMNWKHVA